LCRAVVGSGAALKLAKKPEQTNDRFAPLPLIRLRRRRRRRALLVPVGQQADLVDPRRTDFVDDGNHIAILGARVAFYVYGLVQTVRDAVLDLRGDLLD